MKWLEIETRKRWTVFSFTFFISFLIVYLEAQESRDLAIGQPNAVIDLRTQAGIDLVKAEWKYKNATIVESDFRLPGPKGDDPLLLYPTGKPIKTHNLEPKAGAKDYDDKDWDVLPPTDLIERKGTGLLSFVWYRINITLPEKVANFETKGSTAVFEIVVDDYAEIWVDGQLPKVFGQSGGSVVKGFYGRNRVILSDNVKSGQTVQLAILGINGPLADLPENYIWIHSATIDFYKTFPITPAEWHDVGKVMRVDSSLDDLIEPNVKIEKVATGFQFTEGPVWHPDGYLLFSDPNANVIYRFDPKTNNISIYDTKSGYSGFNIGEYRQPGSNGLALDKENQLVICQHGNRRIIRYTPKLNTVILADRYQGKRLNSPNDLVYRSDGALFFTDPPYGLPKTFEDPQKELPFSGIYCLINGELKLVSKELGGPNGIALSPDEKYLYVGNWDARDVHHTKIVMRYEIKPDGTAVNSKVFFDLNLTDDDEGIDGLKVDQKGNLYVSGPGGVWIVSPEGNFLGKIICPERPANMAWGDSDRQTLYMTGHTSLYRMRTKVPGFVTTWNVNKR